MKRWKIFYGDESTYSIPEDGPLESAPRTDVQCIVWDDSPDSGPRDIGRHILESWDFYLYSDRVGGFHGTNKTLDVILHLLEEGCGPGGVRVLLLGKWIDRERYERIRHAAKTDADFRPVSGRLPAEDGREE